MKLICLLILPKKDLFKIASRAGKIIICIFDPQEKICTIVQFLLIIKNFSLYHEGKLPQFVDWESMQNQTDRYSQMKAKYDFDKPTFLNMNSIVSENMTRESWRFWENLLYGWDQNFNDLTPITTCQIASHHNNSFLWQFYLLCSYRCGGFLSTCCFDERFCDEPWVSKKPCASKEKQLTVGCGC